MRLDHLVLACESLAQAEKFCIQRFGGLRPLAGGKHPHMGTENALIQVGPRAYVEFLAIDRHARPPMRPRWFQLDDPRIQATVREKGPQLLTYVVAVENDMLLDSIQRHLGSSVGQIMKGSRVTSSKQTLEWNILVRPDGLLPHGGRFPTFISWSKRSKHPCDLLQTASNAVIASEVEQQKYALGIEKVVVRDSAVLKDLREAVPFMNWASGDETGGITIQDDSTLSLETLLSSTSSSKSLSASLRLFSGTSVLIEAMNL